MCLRKTFAIPTLNDRSSGTCLVISDVMRWQPLDGAVTVMVLCAHPAVPVTICSSSAVGDRGVQRAQTSLDKNVVFRNRAEQPRAKGCVCRRGFKARSGHRPRECRLCAMLQGCSTHRLLLVYSRQSAPLPSTPPHASLVSLLHASAGVGSVGLTGNWWGLEALYGEGAQTGELRGTTGETHLCVDYLVVEKARYEVMVSG